MDYIDTFYARTLTASGEKPRLEGLHEADCCIIGGGLAGLSTAFHLAEAGKSVILLEENRLGWGASGRNGGFVSPATPTVVPPLPVWLVRRMPMTYTVFPSKACNSCAGTSLFSA